MWELLESLWRDYVEDDLDIDNNDGEAGEREETLALASPFSNPVEFWNRLDRKGKVIIALLLWGVFK